MKASVDQEDHVASGIPPMITTIDNSNENNIDNGSSTSSSKSHNNDAMANFGIHIKCNTKKDALSTTTESETYVDSSSGSSATSCDDDMKNKARRTKRNIKQKSNSGCSESDTSVSESSSDEDSDCDDESSFQSTSTNNSTRRLLIQAQHRLHRQSIYEEVQQLRTQLSTYRKDSELQLRQKIALVTKTTSLEEQLECAQQTIQEYKLKERTWKEDQAMREKEFMNQLNEYCIGFDKKEQEYMGEIIERDGRILDLTNLWNECEGKRRGLVREMEMMEIEGRRKVVVVKKFDDDLDGVNCYGVSDADGVGKEGVGKAEAGGVETDSASDDSSCEYI